MWTLITASWFPLLLSFIIGALTGWWIWARYAVAEQTAYAGDVIHAPGPSHDVGDAVLVESTASEKLMSAPNTKMPRARKTVTKVPEFAQANTEPTSKSTEAKKPLERRKPADIKRREPQRKPAGPKLTAIGIPSAEGRPDDLLKLKGVGPKLNKLLISLGITRFDQIADWKANEVAIVDQHLGSFKGRIIREEWVDQAKLLSEGQIRTFEARYGALDSENV